MPLKLVKHLQSVKQSAAMKIGSGDCGAEFGWCGSHLARMSDT